MVASAELSALEERVLTLREDLTGVEGAFGYTKEDVELGIRGRKADNSPN